MELFSVSIVIIAVGLFLWAGGYLKWSRLLPKYDPLRGVPCVPGFLTTVTGIILFAFYWHAIVGIAVFLLICYIIFKLIVS